MPSTKADNKLVKKPVNKPVDNVVESVAQLRRCKSVTRAEEIQHEEKKLREQQPDQPCHKPRASLFSWASGFDNFNGFINWAFLLLCLGGIRLMLENLNKYGIRANPIYWWLLSLEGLSSLPSTGIPPSVYLLIASNWQVLFTLFIERLLAAEIVAESIGLFLHVSSLIVFLLTPIISINLLAPYRGYFSMVGSTIFCFYYCVVFFKLWSYVHVNYWCRLHRNSRERKLKKRKSVSNFTIPTKTDKIDETDRHAPTTPSLSNVEYPDNLTVKDIYYFMSAPTLCYELNFPRTNRIRTGFVVKRLLEVILGSNLLLFLFQQWIIPSVKNSLIPFSEMDVLLMGERLIKLAIPNHLLWLIWFYLFFHSWLNMLAEVVQFADRDYYADWWNSDDINYFWRTWNLPVHRWALRHLYAPLVQRGYTKFSSSVAVFFVSAFFHEYLVSVPLQLFKVWAFTGMMSQIPLTYLTHYVHRRFGGRWGNMIVWTSLILGTPLCVMMYYHDYVIEHFGAELLEQFSQI